MKKLVRSISGKIGQAAGLRQPEEVPPPPIEKPQPVYHIDSPQQGLTPKKDVIVSGWLVPAKDTHVAAMRIHNGGRHYRLPYGLLRADVADMHPHLDRTAAERSGFYKKISYVDGPLAIEIDYGEGFETLHSVDMRYSSEMLVDMLYNPDLGERWAEHQNLLENNKQYFYEEAPIENYERQPADPRLVAFYLPQFHPIAVNDKAWGTGFTEWTNVAAAMPRFVGHQQPLLPRDLGFYDLRLVETMKQQILLAKQHGIYGFCFYYYWFSGQKLLEQPLETFLGHKEWDFHFSICWANENWTKKWDGRDQETIVSQKYGRGDPLAFITDVESILLDPRYIRDNGKPVLTVFRAEDLKNPAGYVKVWREYFRKRHNQELQLVAIRAFNDNDPRSYGFDAGLDFAPQTAFFKKALFEAGEFPTVDVGNTLLDIHFQGQVTDYRKVALNQKLYETFDYPTYKSVTPSWDNDARRKGKGFVLYHSSPDLYAQWLDRVLRIETAQKESPLVFLNAWNEWAEGAMLEPSLHYGRAVLNRTTEILAKHSATTANRQRFPQYHIYRAPQTKLAVVVHAFYAEEWPYLQRQLSALGDVAYDLFVTINQENKQLATDIKKYKSDAHTYVVPNRGRDVLPFVWLGRRLEEVGYTYVLKLHTKKSQHRSDGKHWLQDLVGNLLPNESVVTKVLDRLEKGAALIGPTGHYVSLDRYMGANAHMLQQLLTSTSGAAKAKEILSQPSDYGYFAGTMFWARLDALKPLLDLHLLPEDFDPERRQIDATLAHATERLLSLLPIIQEKTIYQVDAQGLQPCPEVGTEEYQYAP